MNIDTRSIGTIGVIVNSLLCLMKLIIGYHSDSISIISDAYNNMSDVAVAILLLVGYRIINKPADKSHPYGHERIEYIMSQAVSLMITLVGFEILLTSYKRIVEPVEIVKEKYTYIVLIASISLKIFLALFYRYHFNKTKLSTLKAQIVDSLADSASTTIILIGYIFSIRGYYLVDPIIGIIVSIIIIINGLKILINTSSLLLGTPADKELYDAIGNIINKYPEIDNYHDIRIHNYGRNNLFGSLDVEMDGKKTLNEVHTLLDTLEEEIQKQTGVKMTIHADPVNSDKKIVQYQKKIQEIIKEYEGLTYHDFHYNKQLNKYFIDIQIPYDSSYDIEEITKKIKELFSLDVSINIDRI